MPSIHETAYPRLKSTLTKKELDEFFSPTADELSLAQASFNSKNSRLAFLSMLKTFQRLGYFIRLNDVPKRLISHISYSLNIGKAPDISDYDDSGARRRHISVIRNYLKVKPYDESGKKVLLDAMRETALTKEDLVDIINVGMEELLRLRFELPAFSTLLRAAQYARSQVNTEIYLKVSQELGSHGKALINDLLRVPKGKTRSFWDLLKTDPGKPTVKTLREFVSHLEWLRTWYVSLDVLNNIPDSKLRHFAAEAKSLDTARMQEMEVNKRYTVASALLRLQVAHRLDDLGEILIKRIQKLHTKGNQALLEYRQQHQAETDALIDILHNVLVAMRDTPLPEERLSAVESAVGNNAEQAIERCEAPSAYANDNYAPFLWQFHKGHRKILFGVLDNINLISTTQDKSTEAAISLILQHRNSKSSHVNVKELDLCWISDKWWKFLTGSNKREIQPQFMDRRHFEVCVFSQIIHELKSGDLCIPGSDKYSDYREQLISWEEFENSVADYGTKAGINTNVAEFISELQKLLEDTAVAVDQSFPDNQSLRIENGEPMLSKPGKKEDPAQLKKLEQRTPRQDEYPGCPC